MGKLSSAAHLRNSWLTFLLFAVSPSMEEIFSWENVGLGTCYILTLYHTQRDIPQGFFTCQIPEIYACIHQKRVWQVLLNNKLWAVPFMHIQKKTFSSTSLKTASIYRQWKISAFLVLYLYPWKYSLFTVEAHFQRKFSFKKVICPQVSHYVFAWSLYNALVRKMGRWEMSTTIKCLHLLCA